MEMNCYLDGNEEILLAQSSRTTNLGYKKSNAESNVIEACVHGDGKPLWVVAGLPQFRAILAFQGAIGAKTNCCPRLQPTTPIYHKSNFPVFIR